MGHKTRSRWLHKGLGVECPPQSHHPAKFNDHKTCESGDTNFSNSHLNSSC